MMVVPSFLRSRATFSAAFFISSSNMMRVVWRTVTTYLYKIPMEPHYKALVIFGLVGNFLIIFASLHGLSRFDRNQNRMNKTFRDLGVNVNIDMWFISLFLSLIFILTSFVCTDLKAVGDWR
jgi:hypothetical protein